MALVACGPLAMQALVDGGLATGDSSGVVFALVIYLLISTAVQTIEGLKRWVVFHVGARLHLAMITGFLEHLDRLWDDGVLPQTFAA